MVSIKPPQDMTSAGLYLGNEITDPVGILVLCNGYNNCSGDLIRQPQWRQFAREHRLVLAEIAFASPEDRLTTVGYYYVWHGSGQALLTMLDKAYPQKPPLLMFGFSGGEQGGMGEVLAGEVRRQSKRRHPAQEFERFITRFRTLTFAHLQKHPPVH